MVLPGETHQKPRGSGHQGRLQGQPSYLTDGIYDTAISRSQFTFMESCINDQVADNHLDCMAI